MNTLVAGALSLVLFAAPLDVACIQHEEALLVKGASFCCVQTLAQSAPSSSDGEIWLEWLRRIWRG